MSTQSHWEHVYGSKSAGETSWYRPHLELSIEWITQAAPDRSTPILDVGAGESTLVDDLLALGYGDLTALDISEAALARLKSRLGSNADKVRWIIGSVTEAQIASEYGVWHDRAVFHFLTTADDRAAYVRQMLHAIRPGGHAIVATFGPQGPEKCSGLPTMRYDTESLARELGLQFRLEKSTVTEHETPSGTKQQFLYCQLLRN